MTNGSQRQGVQLRQMPNKPKDKQGFLFFQWMDEHKEGELPELRSSNKDDWPGSTKCDPARQPVNPRSVMQQSTGPKHKHIQENNDASQQWWQHENDPPSNGRRLSQEGVVQHWSHHQHCFSLQPDRSALHDLQQQGQTFVVHREEHNEPNMMFKMHPSKLHHYNGWVIYFNNSAWKMLGYI